MYAVFAWVTNLWSGWIYLILSNFWGQIQKGVLWFGFLALLLFGVMNHILDLLLALVIVQVGEALTLIGVEFNVSGPITDYVVITGQAVTLLTVYLPWPELLAMWAYYAFFLVGLVALRIAVRVFSLGIAT